MEEAASVAEETEGSVEGEKVGVGWETVDEERGVEFLEGVEVSADMR